MSSERADFSCPSCESSDIFRERGSTLKCRGCGQRVHEAVANKADVLSRLSDRDDDVAAIAERLLETGGVSQ